MIAHAKGGCDDYLKLPRRGKPWLYKIVNSATDLLYFGVASNPSTRWYQHQRVARSGGGFRIHEAMRSHGLGSFEFVLIRQFEGRAEAFEAERSAIGSVTYPLSYNIGQGGVGTTIVSDGRRAESARKMWARRSPAERSAIAKKIAISTPVEIRRAKSRMAGLASAKAADPEEIRQRGSRVIAARAESLKQSSLAALQRGRDAAHLRRKTNRHADVA